MNKLSIAIAKTSAMQWWVLSVALFWLATLGLAFIDFAGERWLGIAWSGYFPCSILGVPMALFHIAATICLIGAGVKCFLRYRGFKGVAVAVAIIGLTGTVSLGAYVWFILWYHIYFMGRPL